MWPTWSRGCSLPPRKASVCIPTVRRGKASTSWRRKTNPTYAELGEAMAIALGKKRATVVHLPGPLVQLVGLCGDAMTWIRQRPAWVNSDKMTEALAGSWMCSSAKARTQLGWSSCGRFGRTSARNGTMVSSGRMALTSFHRHQGFTASCHKLKRLHPHVQS